MTVHLFRGLAKSLRRAQPKPDPMRFTRGVVASSLKGQSMVALDGDPTTPVPAFNMAHTQNLPPGTVVRILVVGQQLEVLGSY